MRDAPEKIDSGSLEENAFGGIAIYNGRDFVGEIFDRGRKVAAQLADGRDLGTFPSRAAASAAILAAHAGCASPGAIPSAADRGRAGRAA